GDPSTRVTTADVGGVRAGARFVAALAEARRAGKPVVVLKGGATAASARAAAAHTGALAGEDRVWDAVLREHAAIRVRSQEELLDVALCLSGTDLATLPAGNRAAAPPSRGGAGARSAGQCARAGRATPPLRPESRERLRPLVTPLASLANPIDLTPETYNQARWLELFPQALDAIAADPDVHALFLQGGARAPRASELVDAICALRSRVAKPVCVAWPLAPRSVPERLAAEGVYAFPEVARGARALGHLARYRAALARPGRHDGAEVPA